MADRGHKLSDAEKHEWLHSKGVKRHGEHVFTSKVLHWVCCVRCGLIGLRNAVTQRAMNKNCEWED